MPMTRPALAALACAAALAACSPVAPPYSPAPVIRPTPPIPPEPTPTPKPEPVKPQIDPSATVAYFRNSIGDTVTFPEDQSSLTPAAMGQLDSQVAWLKAHPEFTARIEGHADDSGSRAFNLGIGARRASAVESYLISKGIAPSRLSTTTYGRERPAASCQEPDCLAKNRRAVTVVAGGVVA